MNTTNKKTTTTHNAFTTLLTDFAKQADSPTSAHDYEKALTDLACAVAHSVLKKCIDTSGNKTLLDVKRSITRDMDSLRRIAYASDTAYTTKYNADGDTVRAVNDRDSADALKKLCADTIGDGIDLVHDAVCVILSERKKQKERDPDAPTDFERPYSVRRLNRKVWIKTADSVNGWQTVETTPIREIYKAVRRAIQQSRAVQTDPRNGYTYLSELATDTESDATETIYRRLPKYADLGGQETDFNGALTFYTADGQTVADIDTIIDGLDLTAKQAHVLQLRICGHGERAIATYLGISKQAVQKTLKQIQIKARDNGFTPEQ